MCSSLGMSSPRTCLASQQRVLFPWIHGPGKWGIWWGGSDKQLSPPASLCVASTASGLEAHAPNSLGILAYCALHWWDGYPIFTLGCWSRELSCFAFIATLLYILQCMGQVDICVVSKALPTVNFLRSEGVKPCQVLDLLASSGD